VATKRLRPNHKENCVLLRKFIQSKDKITIFSCKKY
jgi:hypothetical protein